MTIPEYQQKIAEIQVSISEAFAGCIEIRKRIIERDTDTEFYAPGRSDLDGRGIYDIDRALAGLAKTCAALSEARL